MRTGRQPPALRAVLGIVGLYFLLVQARFLLVEDVQRLEALGDGTLFVLAALGHALGVLLALVFGSLAFARRLTLLPRVGAARAAAGTLALMLLYWLYFESLAFALRLA